MKSSMSARKWVWWVALAVAGLSSTAFGGKLVPIKGACVTEFAITEMAFPLYPVMVPVVTLTVQGAGQVSHLGRATCLTRDEVVDFTQGGKLTGTLTITAANGDALVARMDGRGVSDGETVSFSGKLAFIGGSGRFANATGTASFAGSASPASGPVGVGWFAFEGTVSSPGPGKKP